MTQEKRSKPVGRRHHLSACKTGIGIANWQPFQGSNAGLSPVKPINRIFHTQQRAGGVAAR